MNIFAMCVSPLIPILIQLLIVNQFCIPSLTIDVVEKELKTLNTTKATGADNIHAKFLKMSSSTIAPLLTYIFNCCVKQQLFPQAFKLAKVTPIYKKGDKYNQNSASASW